MWQITLANRIHETWQDNANSVFLFFFWPASVISALQSSWQAKRSSSGSQASTTTGSTQYLVFRWQPSMKHYRRRAAAPNPLFVWFVFHHEFISRQDGRYVSWIMPHPAVAQDHGRCIILIRLISAYLLTWAVQDHMEMFTLGLQGKLRCQTSKLTTIAYLESSNSTQPSSEILMPRNATHGKANRT